MACGPNCKCKKDHGRGATSGVGFAFGVAIGAAAGAVLASDAKTRKKARKKLDLLVGDAGPEVLESVKEVAAQVIDDIRDATAEEVETPQRTKRTRRKKK